MFASTSQRNDDGVLQYLVTYSKIRKTAYYRREANLASRIRGFKNCFTQTCI
ncbi:unnamed protein product [Acanthoscelides obtectus]|uniref:Uncharacterized protein n=1 Tax=Acanthoscelides obtectus TaxID=200917 RepID=A0A9P0M0R5_ACAOB|nr:unnamed protein product [Acanthoscelides obtectus]CAK1659147.1 hypothetical protein AOBTE_LOCUS21309 [Acanthoscelides obtectus]